jgi:hypothetical protein
MPAASKQGRIKELSRNCISRYMCQSSIYTEGASESALASIVTAPSCTSPPSTPLSLVVDSVPCHSTTRRHANISRLSATCLLDKLTWSLTKLVALPPGPSRLHHQAEDFASPIRSSLAQSGSTDVLHISWMYSEVGHDDVNNHPKLYEIRPRAVSVLRTLPPPNSCLLSS